MKPTQTVRIPSMTKIQLESLSVRFREGVIFRNLPPPSHSSQTAHLHQTEREDTTESRSDHTKEVEDRVALAHVVADIPGREKIDAALQCFISKTRSKTVGPALSSKGQHLQGRIQPRKVPRSHDKRQERASRL